MDKNNDIFQQAIDDRIDAFIRGMMTEEEEAAFKQEIGKFFKVMETSATGTTKQCRKAITIYTL